MTRYAPQWIQAASYGAAQDRRLIAALWPGPASSGCAVVPVSAMTVQVQAGQVAVPTQNNSGTTLCTSDAAEQVTLTASAAQPRIDLITCHPRGTDLDGGTNNDFIFDFVTGTPAASPTVPATPAGQVALAQIAVGAGVASIVAGNITDVRPGGLAMPGMPGTAVAARAPLSQISAVAGQTVLPPAAATFDTAGGFSAAGYTVRTAGYYQVNVEVVLGAVPTANGPLIQLQRNGAAVASAANTNNFAGNWNTLLALSDVVNVAVGDVLRVTSGGVTAGTAGGGNSYMSLTRLGA